MNGFKPFKRRPNQFKYTPRFYDPQKEERDLRRAELYGTRGQRQEDGDYVVGEYLQRQREARQTRRQRKSSGKKSMWFTVLGFVLILMLAYVLIPRLVGAFMTGTTDAKKYTPIDEYEEFDPYAPIRIVPNDYKEE